MPGDATVLNQKAAAERFREVVLPHLADALALARWLTGDAALAAIVLWSSGQFDTNAIAAVLTVREDAVCRTLAMA
ncbi:MAG: hypothetical protein E5W81_20420, partial [Mesorhizobium sp.]